MNEEEGKVFSKKTFLTSVKRIVDAVTDTGDANHGEAMEDIPAMAIVRHNHAQLHDVIGSLSKQIKSALARQERDFLAAYRAHMYKVQKELQEMRAKVQRNETMDNKSDTMKKVEQERDWYRNEALRLDAFTTSMTKDLKSMKDQLQAIQEDRTWLEKQLKAYKKQNKVLRAELADASHASTLNASSNLFPPFHSPTGSGRKEPKAATSGSPSGAQGLPFLSADGMNGGGQSGKLSDDREEKLTTQIRTLKRNLQLQSNELASVKLQHRLLKHEGDKEESSLKQFFLQCVESVKNDVRRRRDGRTTDPKSMHWGTTTHSTAFVTRKAPRPSKRKISFTEFTSTDRVRLMERLLAHEQVLMFLYNHFFPSIETASTTEIISQAAETSGDSGREKQKSDTTRFSNLQPSASLPSTPTSFTRFDSFKSPSRSRAGGLEATQNRPFTTGGSLPVDNGAGALLSATRTNSLVLDSFTKDYLQSLKPSFTE